MDYRIFRETIIARAEEYASYLEKLLRFKQEQTPLEAHRENEIILTKDPSIEVLCSIRMPPFMQALRLEEGRLYAQVRDTERMVGINTRDHSELLVQLEAVRSHTQIWLDREMKKRPKIKQLRAGRDYVPFVGASWRMLIVVEKTKQKPPKRERLGLKKKKEK